MAKSNSGAAAKSESGAAAKNDSSPASNVIKDPDNWTTGDEPMTGAQSSYLQTFAEQADRLDEAEGDLTKAEASKRIDHLRQEVGLAGKSKPAAGRSSK